MANLVEDSLSSETRKSISIVIPAYNESECLPELFTRLVQLFDKESAYDWQAVIVENGSTDDSWALLEDAHQSDPRICAIRLARNFRMDGGLTAGLEFVDSDACVLMTADLQDPPELISTFIREWERGYENVFGIVTARNGTGPLRTLNSKAFYWLAGKLTDGAIPRNASDFRLLDRKAYTAVRSMRERNRFVRGLVAWVGFRSIGIPMERPPRFAGKSKAYSLKVIELAFKGIFAHSYVPLRLITIAGVALSAISVVALLVSILLWIIVGVPFGGFGTIVSLFLMMFGFLFFMLGILSEYVGLIYEEVKQRPNFIVADQMGVIQL